METKTTIISVTVILIIVATVLVARKQNRNEPFTAHFQVEFSDPRQATCVSSLLSRRGGTVYRDALAHAVSFTVLSLEERANLQQSIASDQTCGKLTVTHVSVPVNF